MPVFGSPRRQCFDLAHDALDVFGFHVEGRKPGADDVLERLGGLEKRYEVSGAEFIAEVLTLTAWVGTADQR